MTITEVSEKYGISVDTLRYYEKAGIIPRVTRNKSGIRNYQEEDLQWVQLAIWMRRAGLPIDALAKYVKLNLAGEKTLPQRDRTAENTAPGAGKTTAGNRKKR